MRIVHNLIHHSFAYCSAIPKVSSPSLSYPSTPVLVSVRLSLPSMSYAVKGVQTNLASNGAVPLRLEIRQLQKNADQFNLYILALDQLQRGPAQTDQLSWYQLSGIHGRPYIPWDSVQGHTGDESSGYCTHSSILFPTWHRPYLAALEQVLHNTMLQIVSQFTGAQQTRYATAASIFRIPYWDWAVDSSDGMQYPEILSQKTVTVIKPSGQSVIQNPLYSYEFHPLDPKDLPDAPFSQWKQTLRYPSSQTSSATSQDAKLATIMDNQGPPLKDRLYNLFTDYPEYTYFSNKSWYPDSTGNYDSLESVHDQIHGLVGGHMAVVDYSAFDPVFYLHHCNVDRLFAIWQALNPDSYVEPTKSAFSTFTTSPGDTEDTNSPLPPFHSDLNGTFWTSTTARATTTFGYTYTELQAWNYNNATDYHSAVRTAVNTLYGSPSFISKVKSSALGQWFEKEFDGASDHKSVTVAKTVEIEKQPASSAPGTGQSIGPPVNTQSQNTSPDEAASARSLDGVTDASVSAKSMRHPRAAHSFLDKLQQKVSSTKSSSKESPAPATSREWVANIRVPKYALDGSFFVHIFDGDFNADPTTWTMENNIVGSHVIFTNTPNRTRCARCIQDAERNLQVTGTIPLTRSLKNDIATGRLASLEPADVEPYLKRNLHWRVSKVC